MRSSLVALLLLVAAAMPALAADAQVTISLRDVSFQPRCRYRPG